MELSKEFAEANSLSEEQVAAINGHFENEFVPTLKKEYDEKYSGEANKNAEGILAGAANYGKEVFGLDIEREKGEKWGDFLKRISDASFSSKEQSLKTRQAEIEEKLKNFDGGKELKESLEAEKIKNDDLLKKIADLEKLEGTDVKLAEAYQELSGLKKEVAYNSVKPNFPENINQYEADAKWNAFKRGVEEKYDLEIVDGKPIAIDKDNQHKRYELATLLGQDEEISKLLEGRKQRGTGGKPVDLKEVEGVPFKIPANATSEELSKLVREHVLKEVGSLTDPRYPKVFSEMYAKVKSA